MGNNLKQMSFYSLFLFSPQSDPGFGEWKQDDHSRNPDELDTGWETTSSLAVESSTLYSLLMKFLRG